MKAESPGEWSALAAPQALLLYAPVAAAALNDLMAATATVGGDTRPVSLVRKVCAETLGLTALPHAEPERGNGRLAEEHERATAAFAEQFSLDVAAMGDEQRADFQRVFGDSAFPAALAVYVADCVPRLRRTLERLFGAAEQGWVETDDRARPGDAIAADPARPFMELMRVVYNMRGIDPVTTELVRLRGARQHQCRICKSLRAHSALAAGADDAAFAAVDHYESSDLSARQKAALALTDAMIWQPAHIPDAVIAEIRANFAPVEAVELALDIMRNAANKPSVALARDAAPSEDVQVYDIDEAGNMSVGLERPAIAVGV